MRRWTLCLLTLALAVGSAVTVQPVHAGNREIAQQIADVMRLSGDLKGYSVAVKYDDGVAWLRGNVVNEAQMRTAVRIAEASPHVRQVINELEIAKGRASGDGASPKSAAAPFKTRSGESDAWESSGNMQTAAAMQLQEDAMPSWPHGIRQAAAFEENQPRMRRLGGMPMPIAPSSLPGSPSVRMASAQMGAPGGPQPSFVPGTGGGVAPASYDQPNLPGYAWPSYAPYPNYSALTYPKQYSPTAWPYIGPFYPYPQVPLGWRKVTLEWDDGWWMLDFKD